MGNLEIEQIQNVALKTAAIEVDKSGIEDGYIDSSEINLFTDKAITILNEKKCTAQEFATLFSTNEVNINNATDVFVNADSLHNAEEIPEALAKEEKETKLAEKQEKINEINAKIAENDKKLKLYEEILGQEVILCSEQKEDKQNFLTAYCGEIATFGGFTALIAAISGSMSLGVIGFAGLAVGIGTMLYRLVKNFKDSPSEEQEQLRNEYKEDYLKVSLENEKLKAQLAELQK